MRIVHEASCPEDDPVTCAVAPYPDYIHDQRLTFGRFEPAFAVGLGKGFQLGASLPLELRVVRVDYTDLDGAPIDAPGEEIHHRDETLAGPSDGRLWGAAYAREGAWVAGVRLGFTVPTGKTTDDPFALTAQGLPHQHLQLGSGTVDPIAGAEVVWAPEAWGLLGSVDARLPVYEGSNGYRGARVVGLAVGPLWNPTPDVSLYLTADPLLETPELWNGTQHGGRLALLATLGVSWAVNPTVALVGNARTTAAQAGWPGSEHGDELLLQRLVASAGVTVRPQGGGR